MRRDANQAQHKKGSTLSPAALENAQRFGNASDSAVQFYRQLGYMLALEAGDGQFFLTRLP